MCERLASARCENYFDAPENAVILKSEDYEVAFNPGGWLRIAPTGDHIITKVLLNALSLAITDSEAISDSARTYSKAR